MTIKAKEILKTGSSTLGYLPEPYVTVKGTLEDIETAMNILASKGYRLVSIYGSTNISSSGGSTTQYAVMEKQLFEIPKPFKPRKGSRVGGVFFPEGDDDGSAQEVK
jgi:hypothetical protein